MFDGIKILALKTDFHKLLQNPYLAEHWNTTVHNSDAVVKYESADYFGLKLQLKDKNIKLQGSLHKYRNGGRHNYDDFTAVEVAEVVRELSERFEINTAQTLLNNVEFGVNVVSQFGVHVVLDNLISYKGQPFERFVDKGISYYQCKLSKSIIKIYDKGKQFNLPNNVLRFEIKVIRMQYLETKGIKLRYLSDLLNMDIYEPLGNILTEVFEGILFGDNTINERNLTPKELETYLRGSHPKTWTPQKGATERKRLYRLENSFKEILERHRIGVNFRSVVSDLIRAKSLELSHISPKSKYESNALELDIVPFAPIEKDSRQSEFVPYIHFIYSGHTGQYTNDKVRKCASCRKVLKDNQIKYCSDRCKIEKEERNARSNDRNNFKKRFNKLVNKPSLFDVSVLVKLSDQ